MRARLPIIALAATALLLAAAAVGAAGRAKGDRIHRSSCLAMDIQFVQAPEEIYAVLLVRWNCTRSELVADLALDAEDGMEPREGHIAGAASATLTRSLGPEPRPGLLVCAYARGEALQRKKVIPVDQTLCKQYFPEGEDLIEDRQMP